MSFDMNVELGEKGVITVTLQNHGEDFEGLLVIEENVSSVYGNTQEQILDLLLPQSVNADAGVRQSRNILYQKEVKLPEGESISEQFTLAIPEYTSQGSLAVRCQDRNGKNIKGTTLKIPEEEGAAKEMPYALSEEVPWELLSDIPVKPQPPLWDFALLLTLYAALAGPVLYLLLKKMKQRYFLFPGITLLSGLFVLLVLGLGGENRLTAPYITYYGVYEQKEECLDYSVKFGIQAPYNESYSLHVDPSYTLIPCMRRNDFLNPVTLGVRKSSNKIKIEEMEEYYRLTMSEMPAFTPNYFQAQKQFPLEKKKQLYASAASRDGKIIGEIWNNTDFSFENVVMVVGNEIVRVGEIPAGGMSTPEAGITYSFTSGGLPLLLNTKLNPQEAEEWEEIAEIYKNIISQNIQNSKMDGYILGVVTGGELDLQMKSGYETYGNNFYLAPVEVSSYPKYRWGE